MTTGPSDHLSWDELACHDAARTPYPVQWRENRAVTLAGVFEAIWATCGGNPLTVLSAYRTPAHNRAVGGSKASQHVQGRALDLSSQQVSAGALGAIVRALAETVPEIGGVGQYATFVHVDIRPRNNGHLTVWDG